MSALQYERERERGAVFHNFLNTFSYRNKVLTAFGLELWIKKAILLSEII